MTDWLAAPPPYSSPLCRPYARIATHSTRTPFARSASGRAARKAAAASATTRLPTRTARPLVSHSFRFDSIRFDSIRFDSIRFHYSQRARLVPERLLDLIPFHSIPFPSIPVQFSPLLTARAAHPRAPLGSRRRGARPSRARARAPGHIVARHCRVRTLPLPHDKRSNGLVPAVEHTSTRRRIARENVACGDRDRVEHAEPRQWRVA